MCTEKQKEYLVKLAKWKGESLDISKVETMSVEEVSTLIDELKAKQSVKKDIAEKAAPKKIVKFNNQRFGMCVKIVCEDLRTAKQSRDVETFEKNVTTLYNDVSRVEEALSASSSSPSSPALITCDYCGAETKSVHMLNDGNTFVCDFCAARNQKDIEADGGFSEITDDEYIRAALNQRNQEISIDADDLRDGIIDGKSITYEVM